MDTGFASPEKRFSKNQICPEYDARTKTNQYWADRLRDRSLDPVDEELEANYVQRVTALTPADVQAAARTYADGHNRARLMLEPAMAMAR